MDGLRRALSALSPATSRPGSAAASPPTSASGQASGSAGRGGSSGHGSVGGSGPSGSSGRPRMKLDAAASTVTASLVAPGDGAKLLTSADSTKSSKSPLTFFPFSFALKDSNASRQGRAPADTAAEEEVDPCLLYRNELEHKLKTLGEDHAATIQSMRALAGKLQASGRPLEAVDMWRTCAHACVRVHGDDSELTLDAIYGYADGLVQAGRYAEAEVAFSTLISKLETEFGACHPLTLRAVGGRANALRAGGHLDLAADLFSRVGAARAELLGSTHPETMKIASGLATTLWRSGRLREAEDLFFRILTRRTEELGTDHLDTIRTVHNLGAVIADQQRLAEAEVFQRRATDALERQLGTAHPEYLNGAHNLASTLAGQNHLDAAVKLYERLMSARLAAQGPQHPETLMTIHNLAIVRMKQGSSGLAAAEATLRNALPAFEAALGADHHLTLTAARTFALALWQRGKPEEAEPILRDLIKTSEMSLGEDHPVTVDAILCLADLLVLHRKAFADANALLQQALVSIQVRDGPTAGRAVAIMNNLATLAASSGRHREAAAIRSVGSRWQTLGLNPELIQLHRHKSLDDGLETILPPAAPAEAFRELGVKPPAPGDIGTAHPAPHAVVDTSHPPPAIQPSAAQPVVSGV